MNNSLKRLSLGLIIWAVPFFVSFFVWDVKANVPTVSQSWFNAIMAFAWAVGFAIAAVLMFKGTTKNSIKEGWTTGFVWYFELIILDLLVLVFAFGMKMTDYYPLLLTYLNALVISVAIGYIRK